jgi:hypothetical protein
VAAALLGTFPAGNLEAGYLHHAFRPACDHRGEVVTVDLAVVALAVALALLGAAFMLVVRILLRRN